MSPLLAVHNARNRCLRELQHLALTRALIYRPDCLVLDEATANLDEAWQRRFFEILASDLPKTTVYGA